jgi:uncharacterized membrane-anchored protein
LAAPRTPSRPVTEPLPGADARRTGFARLGRSTKELTPRLTERDIAVLDHAEIDRLSARELVDSGVTCVINVAPSTSARYPNLGPSVLTAAGVHLVDAPGAPLFDELADGDAISVEGGRVLRAGRLIADGNVVTADTAAKALDHARSGIDGALDAFVTNTMAHVQHERALLSEPLTMPGLRTAFRGRPALVVARGGSAADDLVGLRSFILKQSPVLVAVDGGADVMARAGFRADVIVGDMDSVSDHVLASGAELVVHAYRDGGAPGAKRMRSLGLAHTLLRAPGTSEDAALLLAAELGARPVVSIGSGLGLADFLDRGRPGMSSSLLTRLRLGDVLVDARGLGALLR